MADHDLVRLTLDVQACIGVGQCELLEPDHFQLDEDEGVSRLVGSGEVPRARAEAVVLKCPTRAIKLEGS